MPFKSEAQRRKFKEILEKGKITQAIFDGMEEDTPAKIPERVGPKTFKVGKVKVMGQSRKGRRR